MAVLGSPGWDAERTLHEHRQIPQVNRWMVWACGGGCLSSGAWVPAAASESEHFTLLKCGISDYSAWGPATTVSAMGFVSGLASTDGARISTGSTTRISIPAGRLHRCPHASGQPQISSPPGFPEWGPEILWWSIAGTLVPATGPVGITFDFNSGWRRPPSGCHGGECGRFRRGCRSERRRTTPSTSFRLLASGAWDSLYLQCCPCESDVARRVSRLDCHGKRRHRLDPSLRQGLLPVGRQHQPFLAKCPGHQRPSRQPTQGRTTVRPPPG